MKGIKILAIKGDKRQQAVISRLREKYDVYDVCFDKLPETGGFDVLIMPMLSADGDFAALFDKLKAGGTIFGGRVSETLADTARSRGFSCIDYYKDETLKIKNALPTAEGTLMAVMEVYEGCIRDSKVLVTGFGACARQIARVFSSLGSKICIAARSEAARAHAEMSGYTSVDIPQTGDIIGKADIVINTVPAPIIGEREIKRSCSSTIFAEVASPPYGIDKEMIKKYKKILLELPALPARYAPKTSGKFIADTIDKTIRQKFSQREEDKIE